MLFLGDGINFGLDTSFSDIELERKVGTSKGSMKVCNK